jgi:hypothetical protein
MCTVLLLSSCLCVLKKFLHARLGTNVYNVFLHPYECV